MKLLFVVKIYQFGCDAFVKRTLLSFFAIYALLWENIPDLLRIICVANAFGEYTSDLGRIMCSWRWENIQLS